MGNFQLVLPGHKDVLNALVTGLWRELQGSDAGILQSDDRILVCQFQKSHTALMPLLLVLVGGKVQYLQ